MASVNDPNHKSLVSEIERLVGKMRNGSPILVHSLAYHDVKGFPSKELSRTSDPTSQLIRTRSDRVILIESKCSLLLEAKTGDRDNLGFEAWPFLHHLDEHRRGVNVMYAYRRLKDGKDFGFLPEDSTPISRLMTYSDDISKLKKLVIAQTTSWRPDIRCCELSGRPKGSGDPFYLIGSNDADGLDDWKIMLEEWIIENL